MNKTRNTFLTCLTCNARTSSFLALVFLLLLFLTISMLPGCSTSSNTVPTYTGKERQAHATPAWLKNAVFYEIFVRSFKDSNNDGIGDFRGLQSKLPYLAKLGINALWLMPINPTPSYHGYDVTDYKAVNPDFGTIRDFRNLLAACKRYNIKVIIDLVINHSSSRHPWFRNAASGPDAKKRNFYIWQKSMPSDYGHPWGGGSSRNVWHRQNGWYYYGAFYHGMPDLNHNYKPVRDNIKDIIRFWLKQGVDGFRLDAVRYLIETGGGSDQADTKATHRLLQEYSAFMKKRNPQAVFVGEAWTRIEDAAKYYGDRNELDTIFNFDLASAIINGVKTGKANPVKIAAMRTRNSYPDWATDAPFLANHDMPRVASQIGQNQHKLKSAAAILMTMPGAPFLYYGEEIGMKGGKPDPNIRTPMQWSAAPNAGFSARQPWKAPQNDYRKVNVQRDLRNRNSLWYHYQGLIKMRNSHPALARGNYRGVSISDESGSILAYTVSRGNTTYLAVHNLSGEQQKAEIDILGKHRERFVWKHGRIYTKNANITMNGHASALFVL